MELFNKNIIDKSEWKEYSFDEIAYSINEKVDPNTTDLEIYVGLEHLYWFSVKRNFELFK
ncbi:MAG: hypothetical protein U5K00_00015 [Melioribacteraceae bacterium]|nr:hypothetical protein [Melioribacteraceae bacterium]